MPSSSIELPLTFTLQRKGPITVGVWLWCGVVAVRPSIDLLKDLDALVVVVAAHSTMTLALPSSTLDQS